MNRPVESVSQAELVLMLRSAIDTAEKQPSYKNVALAIEIARNHPVGLSASHVRHNLGAKRWAWLNRHGVYAQERATITPDKLG